MRGLCLTVLLVIASAPADAAPRPPCKGCTLDVPASKAAIPLVVVLHGDREHAPAAAARWRAAVKKQGWALLALECPRDQGCKDSFWKWNGDASWVRDQVTAVTSQVAIDPARIFLVGWSGGATYIGWHAQDWPAMFAAIVIHGGGGAPSDTACVDLPAYFLVGDKNPLHYLVKDLRAYLDGCKQELVWDLVQGADHGREEAALTAKKAAAILTWLDAHARSHA